MRLYEHKGTSQPLKSVFSSSTTPKEARSMRLYEKKGTSHPFYCFSLAAPWNPKEARAMGKSSSIGQKGSSPHEKVQLHPRQRKIAPWERAAPSTPREACWMRLYENKGTSYPFKGVIAFADCERHEAWHLSPESEYAMHYEM